jgi:hypothetical protein
MLFVSVANVNLFSLVILVLAMAGVLLPPRYVVFGTLPTLLYVIGVSWVQYVWNIPFDFPSNRSFSGRYLPPPRTCLCMRQPALAVLTPQCVRSVVDCVHITGLGLVEYELPFVRIGLQWALALGLAVYWRLFTLYRKWAMVRPSPVVSLLPVLVCVHDSLTRRASVRGTCRWA